MKEIWKDIIGYEGQYKISNKGRVKSLARHIIFKVKGNDQTRLVKEKYLSPTLYSHGYVLVTLAGNHHKTIHRLVAQAFIPNPQNKPEVNHIDGNKANYNINNLEWCTTSENRQHAWDTGLRICSSESRIEASERSKIQIKYCRPVINVITLEVFKSIKHASDHYHTSPQVMNSHLNGKCNTKNQSIKPLKFL